MSLRPEEGDLESSNLGQRASEISDSEYFLSRKDFILSQAVDYWRNFVEVSMFRKKPSVRHFTWQVYPGHMSS
jgi:hypothetical protein